MEDTKLRIGDILLKEKIITEEQRGGAECPERGWRGSARRVCIRLKFISRRDLRGLLRKYQTSVKIGDLLLNMGLINGEQLEEALMHQSVAEARLGDTLIELGYITAAELTEAISIQLGYPKIIPNAGIIDKTLLSGLSPSYMKTNLFIPAFKQDGILTVIMANPSTTRNRAVDQQVLFKCEVELTSPPPPTSPPSLTGLPKGSNSATKRPIKLSLSETWTFPARRGTTSSTWSTYHSRMPSRMRQATYTSS